jgi:hypothetical protein
MNPNGKMIAIIGTRRRDTLAAYKKVEEKFFEVYNEGDWIVSGGCKKGGDRFAEMIAKKYGVPILIFYPNYIKFNKWEAPKERNTDVSENADLVIACIITPEDGFENVLKRKKGGTEDTIRKFIKRTEAPKFVHLV